MSAVQHTVTHGADLLKIRYNAVLLTHKLFEYGVDRLGMAGQGDIFIENGLSVAHGRVLEMSADSDAFADTLGHHLLGRHIKQLIFERGTSGVDN